MNVFETYRELKLSHKNLWIIIWNQIRTSSKLIWNWNRSIELSAFQILDFIVKLTVKTLPSTLPTPKVLSPGLAAPVQVSCCLILYRIISLSVKEYEIFPKIQFDKFSHFENFQVRTSVSLLLKFNRMHLK